MASQQALMGLGRPNYQSAIEEGRPPAKHPAVADIDCRSVAYLTTVCLFCVYAAPTVVSAQLGSDPDVAFWIGSFGNLALFIPVWLLGMYYVQLWQLARGRHHRVLLILTGTVPAVMLMIIGGSYMGRSKFLYGQLKADDCSGRGGLAEKPLLQDAYDQARGLYDECLLKLYVTNGNQTLPRRPTLQSCEEWFGEEWYGAAPNASSNDFAAWRGYHYHDIGGQPITKRRRREFNYLASVEANHACGGFCKVGLPLWTEYDVVGRQGTMCAPIVGLKFLVAQHQGEVVFGLASILLALNFIVYIAMRQFLERLGYK